MLLTESQSVLIEFSYQLFSESSTVAYHTLIEATLVQLRQLFGVDGFSLVLHSPTNHSSYLLSCQSSRAILTQPQVDEWARVFLPFSAVSDASNSSIEQTDSTVSQLVSLWQVAQADSSVVAIMGSTVALKEQGFGILTCMRSQPHEWSSTEISAFQIVVHQLAAILSKYDSLQRQLRQQQPFQTVVKQLALAIHRSSDLDEVLQLATGEAAAALGAQRALLLRLKYWDPLWRNRTYEEMPRARVTVTYETRDSQQTNLSTQDNPANPAFWLSECALCRLGFRQPEQLLAINDFAELQTLIHNDSVASVFQVDRSACLLVAPLESQGTVLGFLVFQRNCDRDWHPEELEFIELVKAQVSTAIIQTETLRQVKALVEKRTAELRESLSVQAKLYELTRQQVDQLRRLNELKDEFLSTVSHELRTPLTSMRMAIRILRQVELEPERRERYLDILEQQCIQEANLVNDLLALQELESNKVQMHHEALDVRQLINEMTELFCKQWAYRGLDLRVSLTPQTLKLWSDRDSLSRIFLELLTNAGKYSEPNSQVSLDLSHETNGETSEVVISLANTGAGIAPSELPHVFDKFRRGQGATEKAIQGTGLGLALVKSLLEHLGGAIEVTSEPLDTNSTWKTVFRIRLPQNVANQQVLAH